MYDDNEVCVTGRASMMSTRYFMRSVNPNKRLRHKRREPALGVRRAGGRGPAGGLPVWDTQYFTSRNFYFTEPRRRRWLYARPPPTGTGISRMQYATVRRLSEARANAEGR
jgi:hypothetical protein